MSQIEFEKAKKDYSQALLEKNPFPATALPAESPSFVSDRKDAINKFVTLVNGVRLEGKSSVSVFIGDVGSGKTHLFRVFNSAIQEKLYKPNKGVFPILAPHPGRNFLDFSLEVYTGIGRIRLTQFANSIIEKYIEKNRSEIKQLVKKDFLDKFEKNDFDLEDLLENIQIINLYKNIRKTISYIRDDDILFSILYLAQPSSRVRAWTWLTGSTLTKEEKEHIGVLESNDDVKKSKIMLKDFVELILHNGYEAIVMLVDEFENIKTVPTNQRKIFQDDLRSIIDEFTDKVALLFAITPPAWKDFEKEPTALTRRLRSNMLVLRPFKHNDAKDLIKEYLKSVRISTDKNKITQKFPKCQPELIPFTDDSLDEILEISRGLVNEILEGCNKVLDYFVSTTESEITKSIVKKALR